MTAAVLVGTSLAGASGGLAAPVLATAAETGCHPTQALDLSCTGHAADTDGDGSISATELANLAVPALPPLDSALPHPAPATSLDFKDAATDGGSVLPATLDTDHSQPLMPAIAALGALVVLLRRRPG